MLFRDTVLIRGPECGGASRKYHRRMTEDPLADALEEIATELDSELGPIVTAIKTGESVEEAWEHLLKEALDEA